MEEQTQKKGSHGGSRSGAGRTDKGTTSVQIYMTAEETKLMGGKESARKKMYKFLDESVTKKKLEIAAKKFRKEGNALTLNN